MFAQDSWPFPISVFPFMKVKVLELIHISLGKPLQLFKFLFLGNKIKTDEHALPTQYAVILKYSNTLKPQIFT